MAATTATPLQRWNVRGTTVLSPRTVGDPVPACIKLGIVPIDA